MMLSRYSFSEFVKNVYSLIMTKLFYRGSRFIRRPIYMRGKKSLSGCKNLTLGRFCRFDLDGKKKTLFIGDNCEFGDNTHIVALNKVVIGDNVLIASKVFISDTSHGTYKGEDSDSPLTSPNERKLHSSEVIIGDNVWIGENVVILPGASIGNGCVIGANSVVSKELPSGSIIVECNRINKYYNEVKCKWESVNEK